MPVVKRYKLYMDERLSRYQSPFKVEEGEFPQLSLIGAKFLYYLNPKSLDRNLEWDMKTNLCPTAGKHESRQP